MRMQFGHLHPLTKAEIETIWNEVALTVDTNVLLDLYRYHTETQDALIQALRKFKGRLWLADQAASELVRNRARAASVVGTELADAAGGMKGLESALKKATDHLRGRRPMLPEEAQRLKADVDAVIRTTKASVEELRKRHADGKSTDAILDDLLSLFDGCVAATPGDAELAEPHKEAERRIKEKVPPGYEDAKKDRSDTNGDYLLWHQVLPQAKARACPTAAASCSTTSSLMAPARLTPSPSRKATRSTSSWGGFER